MTSISIPKKMAGEIKTISRDLGVSEEDVLVNALRYYFSSMGKKFELRKELDAWDRASNHDLVEFERDL